MKDVGIDDRQDIGQDCRRHIGDVPGRDKTLEEIIESDKNEITENRIPDADQNKADFLLMIQPQVLGDLFQRLLPTELIKIDPLLFDDQWPFMYLTIDTA